MKASVIYEPTGKVLGKCIDILEAEDLIAVFEQVDPDGVHAGNYGIDPDEEAYVAYQEQLALEWATNDQQSMQP